MIFLDSNRFKELFDEYYNPLCNLAFRYMGSEDASEDVVQDVFVHLWQKRKTISVNTSFKSYLFSSVKNKCIEKLRRLKLESKYIETEISNFTTEQKHSDTDTEKLILIDKLYKSIDTLPSKCKTIFRMAKIEGWTYNEIAEELDLSVKTIESQMRRAFILLRERIK